jgi:hypothetical protein
MAGVVVEGDVAPDNSAVRALGTEPQALEIDFMSNLYAVRVSDGNPWIEILSDPASWAVIVTTN